LKKTILFVALEFPPLNNTGTYRSLKFVKYLPEFGIKPIVITLDEQDSFDTFGVNSDQKLIDEIKDIEIHRLSIKKLKLNNKIFRFFRIFFSLHDKIANRTLTNFKKKIDEIFSSNQIQAVIITFPPFSCERFVTLIKKNYEVKVIVDFRDAWSAWGNHFFPSYFHYRIIRRMERNVFLRADTIVTVTNELKEKFISIHGQEMRKKIEVIPNGFDFEIKNKKIINKQIEDDSIIRVGYIGSFYFDPKLESEVNKPWYKKRFYRIFQYSLNEEDWKYRSPFYFLKTLKCFIQNNPEMKSKIVLEHIGNSPDWLTKMIEHFNLQDNFISHGFKTQSEVMDIAKQFDYLLATSEKNLVGPHYCLPSKIFDYLKLNKPIIAFVTPGSQLEFLKKSGISIFFNPDCYEDNSRKLKELITSESVFEPNKSYLINYHRKNLTKRLSELIKLRYSEILNFTLLINYLLMNKYQNYFDWI
jgi:hypothetical protein